MKVNCFIIDDEPLAINVIESYVDKIPWLNLTGTYTDPLEALEALSKKKVDLIFLDIQMPELSGIELIESLKTAPAIIFTTAFRNFAVEAYEMNGLDYLVKPIKFPRFLKAVDKYLESSQLPGIPHIVSTEVEPGKPAFFIKQGHEMIRVDLVNVLYIESLGDYVKIHQENKTLVVKSTISFLENELETKGFLRIHKSFLIPLSRIESFSKNFLQTREREFPIGRTYCHAVWKHMGMPVQKNNK